MQKTSTRRSFIQIFPIAGVAMLAACSDKAPPAPAPEPVAPPPPAPEPAPAPVAAPEPAPAPAAEPASAPAAPATSAANLPKVEQSDPQALALGYVPDATQADKVKYKTFVAGSHCANCGLFQGKAGDAEGGCPLFPGKHVVATGWCSAWVKKA